MNSWHPFASKWIRKTLTPIIPAIFIPMFCRPEFRCRRVHSASKSWHSELRPHQLSCRLIMREVISRLSSGRGYPSVSPAICSVPHRVEWVPSMAPAARHLPFALEADGPAIWFVLHLIMEPFLYQYATKRLHIGMRIRWAGGHLENGFEESI